MLIPDNIRKLMVRLLEKTINNQANWYRTSRDSEYCLDFSAGKVTIDRWTDSDNDTHIEFAIYNKNGEQVDRIITVDVDLEDYEEMNNFRFLAEFYLNVQRKYLKADETIDALFSELD